MSAEVEGVADVVTGAALARAAESTAGDGGGKGNAATCLNCGASLLGGYCSACGQRAHVHRTLAAFGHEALHSLLHFDGKVWRTLPLLAWRPGHLTRRYVHGERAKFVSPLALFLFCVFLAFAVFGWVLPKVQGLDNSSVEALEKELAEARREAAGEIKVLEAKRDGSSSKVAAEAIDEALEGVREGTAEAEAQVLARLRLAKALEARVAADEARVGAAIADLDARLAQARQTGSATEAIEQALSDEKAYQQLTTRAAELVRKEGFGAPKPRIELGNERLNVAIAEAAKNPQLLLYKLQSNAYKFAWGLIPLSVPFVWLLFSWKREFRLFDHAVFVTYSLCFMLMLATVLALAMRVPQLEAAGGLAMMFIPPLHMYRQVRQAYRLTRWSAVWRTALLLAFASTALGLFGALIVTLGVAG